MTILEIKDLEMAYQAGMPVLRGVSFKVGQGEFVGIIGLSGSGKSIDRQACDRGPRGPLRSRDPRL